MATVAGALPLGLAAPAAAEGPTTEELFFSEYVEGSSNNKALEVYNGTGAAVDLTAYSIQLYFNGGTSAGLTVDLEGSVGAGDVHVVAHAQSDPAILAVADQTNGSGWFNGDDAIVLLKGDTVVDSIGQVGTDPGSQWGSGLTSTADNTLRRVESVTVGDTDTSDAYDPAAGWEGFESNTFDGLGSHLGGGGGGGEEPPPPPVLDCGEPATLISEVQGSGESSPLAGQDVVVEAVVTAVKPGLNAFYVQEEPADQDGDPATSEGVLVYVGSAGTDVEVGQLVRVAATVGSYQQQEQLTGPEVSVCDTPVAAIEPTPVTFPLDAPGDLERYEGMLIELVDELVISEYYNYDRFGEVVVAKPLEGQDRLWTPTAVADPGEDAQALFDEYAKRRITIDDSSSTQNPAVLPHPGNGEPFSLTNRFRGGDTVTGVQGVLDHTFGIYRVQPTTYGEYEAVNQRPADAPEVGGDLTVASFNVLNYFLTVDEGQSVCGAAQNMECRGADSAEELERQRAKLVAALAELDADVVGLMEMENTPGVDPAADLVEGLNDVLGAGTYAAIDTGVIGTDAIRLGYLYKPATVEPVGDFAVLDSGVDERFNDQKNRPMLTQTFDEVATGERFTVSVNHLKSKGSSCDSLGDPDTGDGQGNCNLTRLAAAEAIVDFLASDPTGSGDPDHLVIGDLNSYDHEDPIQAIVDAGYTDLVKQYGGEYAYGYVFDGMAGYLDHALANESLAGQVTGASEWHINADEPDVLDYDTDFRPDAIDAIYAPDAYRSSDHDPVLVGLALGDGSQEPEMPGEQACLGDGAASVVDYQPGLRRNGTPVPPGHAKTEHALGTSDSKGLTLGLGGEVTLELDGAVRDADGDDLRVVDDRDGGKGRQDAAEVLVSQDGETWHSLGTVAGTASVDLADGGLSWASFVRVVDTTPDAGPRSVDGFDVDAVEVLTDCGDSEPGSEDGTSWVWELLKRVLRWLGF